MADISDVLDVMAQLVTTAVYPNGSGQPSVANVQVTIEEGDPIRSQLDQDILNGNAHISIFPTNIVRDVTRFEREFLISEKIAPTIILTISNNQVQVTGTVVLPQSVMLIVNKTGYAYTLQAGDTLNSIATNLAANTPNAGAFGNTITISGNIYSLQAEVATPYTAVEEIRRQEQVITISIWSPTPAIRSALGSAIDQYVGAQFRVLLPDNLYGLLWFYPRAREDDGNQDSLIYTRELNYKMQYATTITKTYTTIVNSFMNSLSAVQSL